MLFLWICLGLLAWLVLPLPIALAVGRFMKGEVKGVTPAASTVPPRHAETAQVA
ncbi:hypothetical protein [Nocardioides sp.]|uniref:hypothetical protein n=1 Tax=Nocardioides sp. TaxID=35761 RepID=UPI002B27B1B3|nr:hypothetical protein [Nocardioides sp.]